MALYGLANLAISTVATAPSPATSGTSLTVAAGHGTRFPDPSTAGSFPVVIWPTGTDPSPSQAEIALCTARSGDVLTLTRAQEGTGARTIVVGDQVMLSVTKAVLDGMAVDQQVFYASGTWAKPKGAKIIYVQVYDGGAGGGSGRRGAAGTTRGAGSGGSGGGWTDAWISAANVDASCSVSVGAGGLGGAAVTTDDTNGNAGAQGGISYFQFNAANSLRVGNAAGQGVKSSTGGAAGTTSSATGVTAFGGYVRYQGLSSTSASLNGGSSGNPTDPSPPLGSGGGGGGEGIDSANTFSSSTTSGPGKSSPLLYGTFSAGAPGSSVAGASGGTPSVVLGMPGRGGAGGKPQAAGPGGAGGAGSAPGGGGGGGAASVNGFNSGAAGNGGDGMVIVWTYF